MVAMETPLERVCVSKISAGMMKERGPQVAEKEMLYSQVLFLGCVPLARRIDINVEILMYGWMGYDKKKGQLLLLELTIR